MAYATLMVHLQLDGSNAAVLQIASNLAARFDAGVIGIVACQPMPIICGDGYSYVSGELYEQDRIQTGEEIEAAQSEFRSALQACSKPIEWRAAVTLDSLSDYLAREARSADLFITATDKSRSFFDRSRHVATGDLVMQTGRPVLLVPAKATKFTIDHVLVGWRETREARRAISDALPMLKKAGRVTIVEIAAQDESAAANSRLREVVGWLKRHHIVAEYVVASTGGTDAARLAVIAQELKADLIVAGAYGHSRAREWALGGVTRDLLLSANCCVLLSH